MATQKEVAEKLARFLDIIRKIGAETSTLKQTVQDLKDAMENESDASPEVVALVEAVAVQLKVVDDLVADNAEPTPPEPS